MRYGDKDGFGSVYDGNGELVLHTDEKVLVTEENVIPSLKSTWRYYGGDYLLEPSKGNIYLTNERLVFINIPERVFAIGGNEARAMDGGTVNIGGLTPGGAQREFFEIPNIEIMASEKREGAVSVGQMVNVYVLSSGNQYHLSMVLTEGSSLLMRLMNKKITNLDELVNDLKGFFQRTDWMYTEMEKSLLPTRSDQHEVPKEKPAETEPSVMVQESYSAPPRRRGPKLGKESMDYFENLFRKGLITKDVFERLMGEYTPDLIKSRPEPPVAEPEQDHSDQELLDLLSGTMGEPAPMPSEVPEAPSAVSGPRKAKKVIKLAVKG